MVEAASAIARRSNAKGKYRVVLMDPPWKGTGCKLNYSLLDDQEWMSVINFDDFLDDGLVFMWAVNSKIEAAIDFMRSRGWKRAETIRWSKVTKDGKPARRGGCKAWHVGEDCLMFEREKPLNAFDKF